MNKYQLLEDLKVVGACSSKLEKLTLLNALSVAKRNFKLEEVSKTFLHYFNRGDLSFKEALVQAMKINELPTDICSIHPTTFLTLNIRKTPMENTGSEKREKGYNFFHVRPYKVDKSITITGSTVTVTNKKIFDARGGTCFAWKLEVPEQKENAYIVVGKSICNKLDNYCKETGRNIAVSNIEAGKFYKKINASVYEEWTVNNNIEFDDFSTVDLFLEQLLKLNK